jgi:hypothetical protein
MLEMLQALYGFLRTYDAVSKHGIALRDETKVLRASKALEGFKLPEGEKLPVDRGWLSYLTGLHPKKVERILRNEEFRWWVSCAKPQRPRGMVKLKREGLEGLTLLRPKLHGCRGRVREKKPGRMPLVYEFEEPSFVKFFEALFQGVRGAPQVDEGLRREIDALSEAMEERRVRRFKELWGSGRARHLRDYVAFRLMETFIFDPKPLIESFMVEAEIMNRLCEKAGNPQASDYCRKLKDLAGKLEEIGWMDRWERIVLANRAFARWVKAHASEGMPCNLHEVGRQIELFHEILAEALRTIIDAYDEAKAGEAPSSPNPAT